VAELAEDPLSEGSEVCVVVDDALVDDGDIPAWILLLDGSLSAATSASVTMVARVVRRRAALALASRTTASGIPRRYNVVIDSLLMEMVITTVIIAVNVSRMKEGRHVPPAGQSFTGAGAS
jgi:hypothetical protein